MAAPILAVGAVLVLTALMSWCGAAHHRCSSCLALSAGVLMLLALAELVLAIVILTQGAAIDQFLRDHQQELKLTCVAWRDEGHLVGNTGKRLTKTSWMCRDEELRKFERNKFLPAYLLLGLFAMEVLRFCCSSELQRARHRRKYQYQSLNTLRDLDDELITVKREHVGGCPPHLIGLVQSDLLHGAILTIIGAARAALQEISSKYAYLKDKYRKKYAAPEVTAISSARENGGPLYV